MRKFLATSMIVLTMSNCGFIKNQFKKNQSPQQRINPNQIPNFPPAGVSGQYSPPGMQSQQQPMQSPYPPSPIPQYNPYAPYGSPAAGNYGGGLPADTSAYAPTPQNTSRFGRAPIEQQQQYQQTQQPNYPMQQAYPQPYPQQQSPYPTGQNGYAQPQYQQQKQQYQAPQYQAPQYQPPQQYQQQNYAPQQYPQGNQTINRRFAPQQTTQQNQNGTGKFGLDDSTRKKLGIKTGDPLSATAQETQSSFKKKDFQYRSRYNMQAQGNLPQQNWGNAVQQQPQNPNDELMFNLNNSNLNNMINNNQVPQTNTVIQ